MNAWTTVLAWTHQPTPIARLDVAGAGSSMLRATHVRAYMHRHCEMTVHNDARSRTVSTVVTDDDRIGTVEVCIRKYVIKKYLILCHISYLKLSGGLDKYWLQTRDTVLQTLLSLSNTSKITCCVNLTGFVVRPHTEHCCIICLASCTVQELSKASP